MQVQFAFIVTLLLVIALLGLAFWLIREFAAERRLQTRMADALPRISTVQVAALASGRRLVLVRYRETEHLLLIGGPADFVIESTNLRPGDVEGENVARSATTDGDPSRSGGMERRRPSERRATNEGRGLLGAEASARPRSRPQQDGAAWRPKGPLPSGEPAVPELLRVDRPAPFLSSADVVPYAPMPRKGDVPTGEATNMLDTGADRVEPSLKPFPESENRAAESLMELEDQLADLLSRSRQQDAGLATPRQWGPAAAPGSHARSDDDETPR